MTPHELEHLTRTRQQNLLQEASHRRLARQARSDRQPVRPVSLVDGLTQFILALVR
jgi:hypothetical protein